MMFKMAKFMNNNMLDIIVGHFYVRPAWAMTLG